MTDEKIAQHTPGPWRVYANGNGGRRLAIQADGPEIAGIDTVETIADLRLKSVSDLPAEANAKLLAAAPTMLEALEWALDVIEDNQDAVDAEEDVEFMAAWRFARAAIEAARS